MSRPFATPLQLELKQPVWWLPLLVALHGTALLVLLLLPFAWTWRLPLALVWLAIAGYLLAPCCRRRHPRHLQSANWAVGDRWLLQFADGTQREARLERFPGQPGRVLQLTLREVSGRRHHLLLLPGMLDVATLRRLRVRLVLHAHENLAVVPL